MSNEELIVGLKELRSSPLFRPEGFYGPLLDRAIATLSRPQPSDAPPVAEVPKELIHQWGQESTIEHPCEFAGAHVPKRNRYIAQRAIAWDRQQRAEPAEAAPGDEARFEELLHSLRCAEYNGGYRQEHPPTIGNTEAEALRAHYRATRLAPQQAAVVGAVPMGDGLVDVCHHFVEERAEIHFYSGGTGVIGDSIKGHERSLANLLGAISFKNRESLEVVIESMAEMRAYFAPAKAEATNTAADLKEFLSTNKVTGEGRAPSVYIEDLMEFMKGKALVPAETAKPVAWVRPSVGGYPVKRNPDRYEQVDCLALHQKEIKHLVWNCEHLVWDDSSGDDFYCAADAVEAYIEFRNLPDVQSALSATAEQGKAGNG